MQTTTEPIISCNIYAVELADNHFLVHPSVKSEERDIIRECAILYDWARKYEPVFVCESFYLEQDTPITIDYFVKKYMQIYGIDNVRGGSYSQNELTEFQKKVLEYEFTIPEIMTKNNIFLKDYAANYGDELEIENAITAINQKWSSKTELLQSLRQAPGNVIIDRSFIGKMEWLKNTMDLIVMTKSYNHQYHTSFPNIMTDAFVQRYQRLIPCLQHLYKQGRQLRDNILFEPMIYLEHPEFLFDVIMCHSQTKSIESVNEAYNSAIKLYERFEYMMYLIINKSDDMIFDIENP
jgi:hypothetical protein